MKEKEIATSVAVVTTEFLSGMCDCMVDSAVGTGHFLSCWGFCMCEDTHGLSKALL